MTLSSCPLPIEETEVITLAHGGGGKQTSRLIEEIFRPAFSNPALDLLHDGARLLLPSTQLLFTTDSYVIQPLFFPGGDIGKLAVAGTMNDLAMCGAKPLYLSCSFIIEEGFSQKALRRIVSSMKELSDLHAVEIVTGDTKVIEREKGGNLFINTTGIGTPLTSRLIAPASIQEGDAIVLSGDVGRHGMAIMAVRQNFSFSSPLMSDCAALSPLVEALVKEGIELHCMRDATRGGVATALVELAESSQRDFILQEESIPVSEGVSSACEILGFDPLYVANEGRFVLFVPQQQAHQAVAVLQRFAEGASASIIGNVAQKSSSPSAWLVNPLGVERALYRISGEQLPRIC